MCDTLSVIVLQTRVPIRGKKREQNTFLMKILLGMRDAPKVQGSGHA